MGTKKLGETNTTVPRNSGGATARMVKRMLVQLNRTAHYATIIVKVAVPICVTEDDIRSAVRTMIIGEVEETAEVRLNPQCVKVVAARLHAPDIGGSLSWSGRLVTGYSSMFMAIGRIGLSKRPAGRYQSKANTRRK